VRPASEQLTQPGGLAERLAGLRSAAGLKAVQLAESLGWARSKVSKIENGGQMPSADDIRAWTEATGHPEVTDELIAMLRQVQEAHTRWRRRLREGGQASIQQELDELTRAATASGIFRLRSSPVCFKRGDMPVASQPRSQRSMATLMLTPRWQPGSSAKRSSTSPTGSLSSCSARQRFTCPRARKPQCSGSSTA